TNSPRSRAKLTLSTASTLPLSVRYSTERSRTSSIGSPGTLPPDWPERGVADLVEGVVEQGERGAEPDDAQAGGAGPARLAGLERFVVLGGLEDRSPAHRRRVAEADELQAGREQHRVQRVGQEAGHDQRGHRRDDLDHDDVERTLSPDPGCFEKVALAQRQGL